MDSIILQTLREFSLDPYRPIRQRDLDLGNPLEPRAGNLVKVVGGMRRSGKSYRLFQEMDSVHSMGVPWDRICYFNFEDERLRPVTSRTGDDVLQAFFYLHPESIEKGVYLFLDEIQEMEDWGAWLRRIVDTTKATIYVSGSSSKMLSAEISTEFRGRAIDFELLPLSFRERLRFDDDLQPLLEADGGTGVYATEERLRLQQAFTGYLERGGFPAVQDLPRPQVISVLQGYVERVVARDVVDRHNFARPQLVRILAQRLLALNGKPLSVRNVENDLRSLGFPTSRETLRELIGYLEEACLLFTMREFSYALVERTTSRPKVYAIDPGLALANGRANSNEEGQRLEDAVYLELRRRGYGLRRDAVSSYRTRSHGWEVDFVTGDALDGTPYALYQVTQSMDDQQTAARETRALWEAMDEAGIDEGTLIVANGEERTYEQNGKRILQVPAWKWFMRDGRGEA